eukprot:ANDGO_06136.mRNA.1 Peroxiredoxin-2C
MFDGCEILVRAKEAWWSGEHFALVLSTLVLKQPLRVVRNWFGMSTPVAVGTEIPGDIVLFELTDAGVCEVKTGDLFPANSSVVVVGVPGAFTPTCSRKHVPGYISALKDFQDKGIKVAVVSVNDPFVMDAWKQTFGAEASSIQFLSDGNAVFTRFLGVSNDSSAYGMGTRCRRFAIQVLSGKIVCFNIENPGQFVCTDASSVLHGIQ